MRSPTLFSTFNFFNLTMFGDPMIFSFWFIYAHQCNYLQSLITFLLLLLFANALFWVTELGVFTFNEANALLWPGTSTFTKKPISSHPRNSASPTKRCRIIVWKCRKAEGREGSLYTVYSTTELKKNILKNRTKTYFTASMISRSENPGHYVIL